MNNKTLQQWCDGLNVQVKDPTKKSCGYAEWICPICSSFSDKYNVLNSVQVAVNLAKDAFKTHVEKMHSDRIKDD